MLLDLVSMNVLIFVESSIRIHLGQSALLLRRPTGYRTVCSFGESCERSLVSVSCGISLECQVFCIDFLHPLLGGCCVLISTGYVVSSEQQPQGTPPNRHVLHERRLVDFELVGKNSILVHQR